MVGTEIFCKISDSSWSAGGGTGRVSESFSMHRVREWVEEDGGWVWQQAGGLEEEQRVGQGK